MIFPTKPNATGGSSSVRITIECQTPQKINMDTLNTITTPVPGNVEDFIEHLQLKLDEKNGGNSPEAPSLTDITLV